MSRDDPVIVPVEVYEKALEFIARAALERARSLTRESYSEDDVIAVRPRKMAQLLAEAMLSLTEERAFSRGPLAGGGGELVDFFLARTEEAQVWTD